MFARVTIGEGKPQQLEAAVRNFRENVVPAAKKMAGFKGSYFMVDRKSGKILGVALWDTKENLEAGAEVAARLGAGIGQAAGMTKLPAVEIYEVAVQL
jgi:heme-degrading monooxygenase HmoA